MNVPLAPLTDAVNVTDVPATRTGLPDPSSTVALSCVANAIPTVVLWPDPAVATTCVGGSLLFSLKLAGVRPVDDATMVYVPTVSLAVNAVVVTKPLALVTVESVSVLFANVPDAPLTGAVKVTLVPDTRTALPY
jgi:hypothetical protein